MAKLLDSVWQEWVKENVELGVPREVVFNTLAKNNFDLNDIEQNIEKWRGSKVITGKSTPSTQTLPNIIYDKQKLQHERRFIYNAKKIEISNDSLDIWEIDNFLSKEKCDNIIEIIKNNSRTSEVSSTTRGESYADNKTRTSSTCDLNKSYGKLITDLDERISSFIGIHKLFSETLQGQWYKVGEEFKPHTDYFAPNTDEYKTFCAGWGQRTWTFMVYLNKTPKGGETKFTKVKTTDGKQVSFKPSPGKAVIWNNLYVNGEENSHSEHHGVPVKKGEKFIITKWFREKRIT